MRPSGSLPSGSVRLRYCSAMLVIFFCLHQMVKAQSQAMVYWRIIITGSTSYIRASKVTCPMCQPHELIPLVTCIQSFTWSSYIRSLRSHWSLLGPDGKDSEGRTWFHWIVHQKWPVQCANLMNSFLLVIEIYTFKVLPSIGPISCFHPNDT